MEYIGTLNVHEQPKLNVNQTYIGLAINGDLAAYPGNFITFREYRKDHFRLELSF